MQILRVLFSVRKGSIPIEGFRAGLGSLLSSTIPVLCPTRKFVPWMASPELSVQKDGSGNFLDVAKACISSHAKPHIIPKSNYSNIIEKFDLVPKEVQVPSKGKKLHDFNNIVTGGPGSGKGTQSALIVEHFGFTHLSAGDLLQEEIESGSQDGKMIQECKKEGKIVPSEVTVKLLQQAMQRSKNGKFIIDGFPRNEENRAAFERIVKIEPDFVLFFDCSEEELTRRILNRNQGRVDDNIETIPKRLKVYFESTLPVIDYYSSKGKLQKIDADRPVEEVFEEVKSVVSKFTPGSDQC